MPKSRESSARALETKRFEAAMRSPRVRKLIQQNTGTDRVAAMVDSSPYRVRAWLKAREAVRERR